MLEPLPGCEILSVDMPYSSTAMKTIAEKTDAEYTLLYTKKTTLELGMFALGNGPYAHRRRFGCRNGLCRPLPDSRRQADECSCHSTISSAR